MQTIWKFILSPGMSNIIDIEMPLGSKILDVQNQDGNACIWALVDTIASKTIRRFEVFGTGHEIKKLDRNHLRNYIGTFQIDNGMYVFHVFEVYSIEVSRP